MTYSVYHEERLLQAEKTADRVGVFLVGVFVCCAFGAIAWLMLAAAQPSEKAASAAYEQASEERRRIAPAQGARLSILISRDRISRDLLAEVLNLDLGSRAIVRMEYGQWPMTDRQIGLLCELFDVDRSWFLEFTEEELRKKEPDS